MTAVTLLACLFIKGQSPDPSGYLKSHAAFSARLKVVKDGDSFSAVKDMAGSPSWVVENGTNFRTGYYSTAWYYASGKSRFPDLGSVYFDQSGRVCRVFGNEAPSRNVLDLLADTVGLLQALNESPGLYGNKFESKKVLDLCTRLSRMTPKEVGILLDEYIRLRPLITPEGSTGMAFIVEPSIDGNDGRLAVLLRTLLGSQVKADTPVFREDSPRLMIDLPELRFPPMIQFYCGYPVVLPIGVYWTSNTRAETLLVQAVKAQTFFSFRAPSAELTQEALRQFKNWIKDKGSANAQAYFAKQIARQLDIATDQEFSPQDAVTAQLTHGRLKS